MKNFDYGGAISGNNVLEPACGGGHISDVLETYGYTVENSDIINRGYRNQHRTEDFLPYNHRIIYA